MRRREATGMERGSNVQRSKRTEVIGPGIKEDTKKIKFASIGIHLV